MKLFNKKARFEYKLTGDKSEAGIALSGAEARALREGRGDLSRSFVKIIKGEGFFVNANIPVTGLKNYDPTQTRKLLLHKREILSLTTKTKQLKLQAVPIVLYNKGRLIKLSLELGKSKREFEKREAIKHKDVQRDIETELKDSV